MTLVETQINIALSSKAQDAKDNHFRAKSQCAISINNTNRHLGMKLQGSVLLLYQNKLVNFIKALENIVLLFQADRSCLLQSLITMKLDSLQIHFFARPFLKTRLNEKSWKHTTTTNAEVMLLQNSICKVIKHKQFTLCHAWGHKKVWKN